MYVCVCALARWAKFTFDPLQQILFYINFQILSISSFVLGVVIAQIWSLCFDWLCFFWSRCRDPHTRFWQKCRYLAQYWFQRFPRNNQLIVLVPKDFLAHFEKQDGHHSHFSDFILNFMSHYYYGCVIATVFKLLGEIRY